jgi:hypothetical protein
LPNQNQLNGFVQQVLNAFPQLDCVFKIGFIAAAKIPFDNNDPYMLFWRAQAVLLG